MSVLEVSERCLESPVRPLRYLSNPKTPLMSNYTYRIIGFGTNQHGLFNQFHWGHDISSASETYSELLHDPEMDGVVLIRVNHESWEVILEYGTEGMSVVYGPLGNFKVLKAPELVMV